MSWSGYWEWSMSDMAIAEALSAAAADVLETMCFSPVLDEAAPGAVLSGPAMAARLRFSGGLSGTFALRVSAAAAAILAANFLGEEADHAHAGQVPDVVCELSNMMCGSVLSRMDSKAHFDLEHPELVDAQQLSMPQAASRAFDIGEGEVAVFLEVDKQP